jgi:uncharacterized membrane protein YcjF (UPF0283 family)
MLFRLCKRAGEESTNQTQPRSDSDSALMDMMESNNRAELDEGDDHSQHDLPVKASLKPRFQTSTCTLTIFLLLLGLSVSAGFLVLGISAAFQTQHDSFERRYVVVSWHFFA